MICKNNSKFFPFQVGFKRLKKYTTYNQYKIIYCLSFLIFFFANANCVYIFKTLTRRWNFYLNSICGEFCSGNQNQFAYRIEDFRHSYHFQFFFQSLLCYWSTAHKPKKTIPLRFGIEFFQLFEENEQQIKQKPKVTKCKLLQQ